MNRKESCLEWPWGVFFFPCLIYLLGLRCPERNFVFLVNYWTYWSAEHGGEFSFFDNESTYLELPCVLIGLCIYIWQNGQIISIQSLRESGWRLFVWSTDNLEKSYFQCAWVHWIYDWDWLVFPLYVQQMKTMCYSCLHLGILFLYAVSVLAVYLSIWLLE